VNPEIGGWSIGPRYIVLITPFLAFGAAAFLEELRRRSPLWQYALVIPLSLLSITYTFLSTIVFHTFPPAFTNPFYEWVLPLMRMGYFNYSLGTWLGARGLWSALPGMLPVGVMAVCFCWGPQGPARGLRLAYAATAALVASLLFTALSHVDRFDSAGKDGEFHRLVMLWEPSPADDRDLATAELRAAGRPDDVRVLADFGRLLAASGRSQAAIDQYARAADVLSAPRNNGRKRVNRLDPHHSDR
jgi:hypothetical protein